MKECTELPSPSQLQIRVQILLFRWLEGRPEYYENGETEKAKCNRSIDFERTEDDFKADHFVHKTSHREDFLIAWLDIEMKISKLQPIHKKELYYYLKDKRGVGVAYWEAIPSNLQIALVDVMLPLLV